MTFLNLRFLIKKIVFLTLLCLVLFSNQACQINQSRQQLSKLDQVRIHHSQELLGKRYQTVGLESFEGDFKMDQYIKSYMTDQNKNLDAHLFTQSLLKISREQKYDPVFLLAVMKTESQFNPLAKGSAGEIGLMQIKPDTAEWICQKAKLKWLGAQKLYDPEYNILVATKYFSYLKRTFKAKGFKYINAYNMGINNLQRLPASSQKQHPYYDKVIANYLEIYENLKKIRKNI